MTERRLVSESEVDPEDRDGGAHRQQDHGSPPLSWFIIAIALFLFLRGTIAVVRSVFFDELFTRWITSFPVPRIFEHLRVDSGPPLYYLIASILPSPSSVASLRVLSIAFSAVALIGVIALVKDPVTRLIAALLLATWPVHVVMSTDARAYALFGALTGIAVLSLHRWVNESWRRWLGVATLALAAAIWTHWYGFVFALLPLVAAVFRRRAKTWVDVAITMAVLGLVSLPALQLLRAQPSEASAWMAAGAGGSAWASAASIARALSPAPLTQYPIAPAYSEAAGVISALLFACVALIGGFAARTSRDVLFHVAMTLVPIAGILVVIASGRPAYFPGRFEAALAVPFVLLVAYAIRALPVAWGRGVTAAWLVIAILVWGSWVVLMPREIEDPWRTTATWAREAIPADAVIVATGPMYLELVSQREPAWNPTIVTFPEEQAEHPGWRARPDLDSLERGVHDLPASGWWAGEPSSAELRVIAERFRVEPVFGSGPVGVARISDRPE